jgi:hypothetical protein
MIECARWAVNENAPFIPSYLSFYAFSGSRTQVRCQEPVQERKQERPKNTVNTSENPYIYGKHAVGDMGVSTSWRVRRYSLARRGPEPNYLGGHFS